MNHWSGYNVMYIQQLFEQCYVRLKNCSKCNVKIRNLHKKRVMHLQKSSELLSIQRNLFDRIGKFWYTTRFSFCETVYTPTTFLEKIWFARWNHYSWHAASPKYWLRHFRKISQGLFLKTSACVQYNQQRARKTQ